jgi:hypothetical protein
MPLGAAASSLTRRVTRASCIALLVVFAALAAPADAAARATAQDRAFARAYERYDAAILTAFQDPAALAGVQARQHAAAFGCLDAASALGASQDVGAQLAGSSSTTSTPSNRSCPSW